MVETNTAIVLDIPEDDLHKVRNCGVPYTQYLSWSPERRTNDGFSELLIESELITSPFSSISNLSVSTECTPKSLDEYFSEYGKNLQSYFSDNPSAFDSKTILILNLFPYCFSTSLIDKIVTGLFPADKSNLTSPDSKIVILVRNIDWILKSEAFIRALNNEYLQGLFLAIDFRGYGALFQNGKQERSFRTSRDPFHTILSISYENVYKSLIFETNNFIGHFKLPNSHLRTHYDLTEFIIRDNVWEYFLVTILGIIGDAKSILVIGTGIENNAIHRIGDQIKSILGDSLIVEFIYLDDSSLIDQYLPSSWSKDYDLALVVGDIVNSGLTLKSFLSWLVSNNSQNKQIKVFAVAKMANSRDEIEGIPLNVGVTIRREFYENDEEKCQLCQLSQPLIEVKTLKEFSQTDSRQLTPFDFWEIVEDSEALRLDESDPQERKLLYRIDTSELVRRYGNWFRNVISQRFEELWPNIQPDVICTVKEDPSIDFAKLVSNALNVNKIVKIHRDDLRRLVSVGGLPEGVINPFESDAVKVLIVDDGINYGGTIKSLISFCKAAGIHMPVGVVVLDSRLSSVAVRKIRQMIGNRELLALYSWSSSTTKL